MRRSFPFVILVLIAAIACAPPPPEPRPEFTAADDAALRSMLGKYVTDVVAHDWDAVAGYYTTDAVRMPPHEPTTLGRQAIRAWLDAFPPLTDFTLTPQDVTGDGDLATARGTLTLALAPPDAEPIDLVGKWQAVYRRQRDGAWLCVSDIWNFDAPMTR